MLLPEYQALKMKLLMVIKLMKTKTPDAVHPGEILLYHFLEPLCLSQSALARA